MSVTGSVFCAASTLWGGSIPNFYIFKGKRMCCNFLDLANPEDIMAMQPQAWMTSYLFDAWISHFITLLQKCPEEILATNQHLLVVDGHISHVTLQVVSKATAYGLDILMMPSHILHYL
jgi:hypothetical protein